MRVAPSNVINVSNFCNKIFRGFRSTGGQNPRFPIDFAGHRHINSAARSAACDNKKYNNDNICSIGLLVDFDTIIVK